MKSCFLQEPNMEPTKKDSKPKNPGAVPNFDDQTVREQIKKKDYDVIKQTYEDLAREEDELKGFFKDLKTPTKEDPTLIRNTTSSQQTARAH